jgi:hypothetical protein
VESVDNQEQGADASDLLIDLGRLRKEEKRLARRAKALELRRIQIEIAIAATTRELEVRGVVPDSLLWLTAVVDGPLKNAAGLSITETCDQALRRAGQPLTVHQLLEVLEASGKDMSGLNAHRVIYAALRRNPRRFRRVGPGLFDLESS